MIDALYNEVGMELTRLLVRLGYTYSVAKVLALLMISPKPLSMKDIKRFTGLSIGSISLALKNLETEGIISYIKRGRVRLFWAAKGLRHVINLVLTRLISLDMLKSVENKSKEMLNKGHKHLNPLIEDIKKVIEFIHG